MAAPMLDFWYDFASSYSYLAANRIGPLAEKAGVTVRWRPFLLGPIFKAQGMESSPFNLYPVKGRYMWRDMERCAEDLGLVFNGPSTFPQNSVLPGRIALVGHDEGWGEAFTRAVYLAEFVEDKLISDAAVMVAILKSMGRDADAVMARAQSDDIKNRLRTNTEEAQALNIFGAPSFVTADKELFWGNDRLDQALRWAKRLQG